MEIKCPHFKSCSGCVLEKNVEHPKSLIEAQQFFSEQNLHKIPWHTGDAEEWRHRARLAVRGTPSHPCIGLFREGTHELVNIPLCKVHHPLINHAVEEIREWIIAENISLYNEGDGTGFLRYIQLTVSRVTHNVQLVLVLNSQEAASLQAFNRLKDKSPALWHSFWLNFNTGRNNLIFGKKWQHLFGAQWCIDRLRGRSICMHPESFMQANPAMFEHLLERLSNHVHSESSFLELYAGVGAIGLSLLDRCRKLVCVEIAPIAKECFTASCEFLPEEEKKKASFYATPVSSQTNLLKESWDIVLVDPPRKGLDPSLMQALLQAENLKTLVYISCCWKSFKRDCIQLQKSMQLIDGELFLFFPGSEHLEILAIFEHK